MAIDLRSVAKRLRKSALVKRLEKRAPEVGHRASEVVRALLPPAVFAEAASRGNGFASWRPPPSVAPAAYDADPALGLAAHLGQLVHKRLGQLVQTIDFADAEDPVEALHDLRVASRRLRAFVQVFEPLLDPAIATHVSKPLRRVTRAAGELRDLDVQMALMEARLPAQGTDATRAALEHLLEGVHGRRDDVKAHAQRRLRKVKRKDVSVGVAAVLGEVVARLPATPEETATLAWSLLEPHVARVEADEKPLSVDAPPEAFHRLRISIKKLRYALELVAPLLGTDRDIIKHAESLQELLGTHHDLFVIAGLEEEERRRLEAHGRKTLPFGLGVLRGELEAEERELVQRFEAMRAAPGYYRHRVQAALSRFASRPPSSNPGPNLA